MYFAITLYEIKSVQCCSCWNAYHTPRAENTLQPASLSLEENVPRKNKVALPLFFRSTLVNKEPDSMLAHMFKDKG